MLKSAFFFLAVAFSFSAQAEMITGQIVNLQDPEGDDLHLFYMDSGRVLRVIDAQMARVLEGAMIAGETLNITVNPSRGADEITSITPVIEDTAATALEDVPEPAYIPTDVGTMEDVNALHQSLITSTRVGSICSNRAHVWAYRMWRDRGVKSMKAFLFFTSRYIRKYRGEWWYHVTPYVHGAGGQYALDRRFFKEPMELSAWASKFVKNRFECPYIEKYKDYKDQNRTGWCFVSRVPMYVWMPWGVRDMDTKPAPTEFNMKHVKKAVSDALTRKARRTWEY